MSFINKFSLTSWTRGIKFLSNSALEHVNISRDRETVEIATKADANNSKSTNRNIAKEIKVFQSALNSSFCKGKADGPYLQDNDCEHFILCAQGKTLRKKCPNGLRYNAEEGVCDWPTNVGCGEVNGKRKISPSDEILANSENDEDIYTKKFIGRTKLNETVSSIVET